ncbi:hypothetical protein AB0G04_06465 [Actinoplanes sp. NPDC023801]|uniref:hypothetical protein n=1 Tax=Actinoplanes sp. NPDC023801 TaxID=3154595 RepID=UPI0033D52FB4
MTGRVAGRRPLLSVDARGYGAADGRRQMAIQQGLIEVMTAAAAAAGLPRNDWDCQPAGDGELAVLPAGVPESALIDDFVRLLAGHLADHNEDRRDDARLRLRLAVHNGVVERAANGWAGAGAVVVSRLADAGPARAAQEAIPAAGLVVVLSNRVFLDTVAQGHTSLRAVRFRKVEVRHKEFRDDAWLYCPDGDVHALDLEDRPITPDHPPRTGEPVRQSASVINNFHRKVTAEVIGIQENRHG